MENQNKNYNRAIIILVLGIILGLWVMVNARLLIEPIIIYTVIGIVSIAFYLLFPKIKI